MIEGENIIKRSINRLKLKNEKLLINSKKNLNIIFIDDLFLIYQTWLLDLMD